MRAFAFRITTSLNRAVSLVGHAEDTVIRGVIYLLTCHLAKSADA